MDVNMVGGGSDGAAPVDIGDGDDIGDGVSGDGGGDGDDRFELAWFALAFLSLDFVIEKANTVMAELLGAEPGALTGRSLYEFWPGETLQREEGVADALRRGDAPVFEYDRTLPMPDGSTWQGVLLLSVLRDEEGKPVRFYFRLKPGEDERQPPPHIAAREGDFPLSVDQMGIGIALIGLDSRPLLVNRALCEMTGYARNELLATDLLSLTHPDDQAEDIELGTKAWMGEIDSWKIEKRLIRRDGSSFWAIQEITVVRDENGELVQFVGQLIDIDALKQAEAKLREQARLDPLTNLANRTGLQEHCAAALAAAVPPTLTVLFVDLDGFKAVNDRYGHGAGDGVLQVIAGRIAAAVRPGDLLSRIGGDEFVAVCLDLAPVDVAAVAERIIAAVAQPCLLYTSPSPRD